MKFLKQAQVWGFIVSIAAMALISVAFFYPDNIDGNTLMQSDIQQGAANGQEGLEYQQRTGEKALWTNSLFSGMPTFQISPSYPSNALFQWINDVYGLWLPSPSNLLFMMMFGFLIFMYCMRVRWYYALLGAIAWGFSSYYVIIIGAGHIWKFLALTYVPPTIGGLVLCYRGRYLIGAAITALFAMLQLNANHPQMTYYFAFVMAGFAIAYLVDAIREKKTKQWVKASCVIVGAGILAIGANLPSIYNTYEYSKETKRSQSELAVSDPDAVADPDADKPTGGLPKSEIVNWSYGRSEILSLLVPNIKGGATAKPEKGQMQSMGLDRLDSAADAPYDIKPLLPYFTQYFNDSEGTNGPVYVGAIICALFLLGCIIVKGPLKWALLALTVLSLLLSLGRNCEGLSDFMIYHFPMYNKFRAVESILVVAEFTMPVLAVLALVQCLRDVRRVNYMKELNISFGICAALCLVVVVAPSIFGTAVTSNDMHVISTIQKYNPDLQLDTQRIYDYISDMRYSMVRADAFRSLIFIVLAYGILAMAIKRKLSEGMAVAGVGVLVLIDLYGVDKRYVDHESFVRVSAFSAQYNPFAPDQIDQAISTDNDIHFRVMDIPGFWSPTRSYHHKMIGGYHAAKLNRYEDLIQNRMRHVLGAGYIPQLRDDSIAALYPAEQREMIDEMRADYRVLDMLNAKYVITGDEKQPLLINPDALGNAWIVSHVDYVDGARAEMDALATIDPTLQAVADKKYEAILGTEQYPVCNSDYINLLTYTPNTLTYDVNTAHGGIAVFSEIYFPWGWKATIDGESVPLGRVNYVLRALKVPAGKHQIITTFDPASLHVTGAVAYACVTIIYLLLAWAIFRLYVKKETNAEKVEK